jgi:outer membrane protein TolC
MALKAADLRAELAQREIQLSLRVEEAERIRMRHGESGLLQVNLREQATADARARLVDAELDRRRAEADFSASRGFFEAL